MTDWCFTGHWENWKYGVVNGVWATNNEYHHPKWFKEMKYGDNVVIYIKKGIGVAGFCKIGEKKVKKELWWPDEIESGENLYPNVIYVCDINMSANIGDLSMLQASSLTGEEYRSCGLTQRNITGGVNVIRNPRVFQELRKNLLEKHNGILLKVESEYERYERNQEALENEQYQRDVERATPKDVPPTPQKRPDRKIVKGQERWQTDPSIAKDCIIKSRYACEVSPTHKPFISKVTSHNYVEAHHFIPMKFQEQFSNSLDVPANIIPICPNCHSLLHHAAYFERSATLKLLLDKRKEMLSQAGISVSLDKLSQFYR